MNSNFGGKSESGETHVSRGTRKIRDTRGALSESRECAWISATLLFQLHRIYRLLAVIRDHGAYTRELKQRLGIANRSVFTAEPFTSMVIAWSRLIIAMAVRRRALNRAWFVFHVAKNCNLSCDWLVSVSSGRCKIYRK